MLPFLKKNPRPNFNEDVCAWGKSFIGPALIRSELGITSWRWLLEGSSFLIPLVKDFCAKLFCEKQKWSEMKQNNFFIVNFDCCWMLEVTGMGPSGWKSIVFFFRRGVFILRLLFVIDNSLGLDSDLMRVQTAFLYVLRHWNFQLSFSNMKNIEKAQKRPIAHRLYAVWSNKVARVVGEISRQCTQTTQGQMHRNALTKSLAWIYPISRE